MASCQMSGVPRKKLMYARAGARAALRCEIARTARARPIDDAPELPDERQDDRVLHRGEERRREVGAEHVEVQEVLREQVRPAGSEQQEDDGDDDPLEAEDRAGHGLLATASRVHAPVGPPSEGHPGHPEDDAAVEEGRLRRRLERLDDVADTEGARDVGGQAESDALRRELTVGERVVQLDEDRPAQDRDDGQDAQPQRRRRHRRARAAGIGRALPQDPRIGFHNGHPTLPPS